MPGDRLALACRPSRPCGATCRGLLPSRDRSEGAATESRSAVVFVETERARRRPRDGYSRILSAADDAIAKVSAKNTVLLRRDARRFDLLGRQGRSRCDARHVERL